MTYMYASLCLVLQNKLGKIVSSLLPISTSDTKAATCVSPGHARKSVERVQGDLQVNDIHYKLRVYSVL